MLPGPEPAPLPESEIDVHYYLHVLWRGRFLVATAMGLGLLLGLLVAFVQTPEYRAAAMLQIDPPTPAFLSVQDAAMIASGGLWQNADYYNTQFKVLKSSTVGHKVVERLKLTDSPAFKEAPDASALLMAHVNIEPIPESRLVMVQVTHEDAKEAALWANTVAEVYMQETLSSRVEAAKRAYDWLQDRLSATHKEMLDAREKLLQSYTGDAVVVTTSEDSPSVFAKTLTKLTEEAVSAQTRRLELDSVIRQVVETRRRGGSLDAIPQVAVDKTFADLTGQIGGLTLELSRMREKYKEGHPEVRRIQAEIDRLGKAQQTRADQILDGLKGEAVQLGKRETELKGAIEAQKTQAASQSRKATELEALKKEAQSANSLYDMLLQKLKETDIAASIRSNNVSVIEKAYAPRSPIRPDKRRIATVGVLLGLILGVGLVVARDLIDNTVKSPEDVERYLRLDLLTAVPRYDDSNVHLVTEAYQSLRTALIFGRRDDAGQVVLITGTAPQEGKTTTLVNLGKLLASSGEKTLLLDLDLRRANLHTRLGVTREPGITDFFVKHENLDVLVRPTRLPNLFVLTAGALPPNPPAILARRNLADVFDHLRRHFEWILVDSPPLASVTDALLTARHADLALFVIQHNTVDKKLVRRSIAALRKVTPNLLGAVLNVVNTKASGYYYYYYQRDEGGTGKKKAEKAPVPAAKT